MTQEIKIKLLKEGAKLPKTESNGSAGYDIWGVFESPVDWHEPHSIKMIPTGFATEFDNSLVARVWERGSTGTKNIQVRAGVVDSNFRGEWKIVLNNGNDFPVYYVEGKEGSEQFLAHLDSIKNMYSLIIKSDDVSLGYEGDLLVLEDSSSSAVQPLARVYSQEKAIAQFVMVQIQKPELVVVEELSSTQRGEGMLGSSGH
jgi:dUTPase